MTAWDETPKWLVPRPTPEDREFWEGAGRGELRIQRCGACGMHQHYARLSCRHCGAPDPDWVTASGQGTIYSFTVIRQNGVPPFNERLPYVVAAVDLDEAGARVLAPMPALAPDEARVGLRVRAAFRPAGDGLGFVDFEPSGPESPVTETPVTETPVIRSGE